MSDSPSPLLNHSVPAGTLAAPEWRGQVGRSYLPPRGPSTWPSFAGTAPHEEHFTAELRKCAFCSRDEGGASVTHPDASCQETALTAGSEPDSVNFKEPRSERAGYVGEKRARRQCRDLWSRNSDLQVASPQQPEWALPRARPEPGLCAHGVDESSRLSGE